MKKLTLIIFILIAVNISAQTEKEGSHHHLNEIGISVSDLINGALQIEYERMLGKHISVGLGVGFKGDEGLIRLSGLDTDNIKTNNLTYSGFKFIPAVRYYINKTTQYSMDGFYFGAYLKYSNYKSDLDGTYIDDMNDSYTIEFDAKFNVTSVGFMIGYKLPINEKFSVNFLIAGPGVGFHNYSLTNKRDLPDQFYEDLNNALDQYSIFDLINTDFKFSDIETESNFVIPSLRYGISLGYSF